MTTTTIDPRLAEFIELRDQGLTLRQIGDRYGLSYERIRQILAGHDPMKDPNWRSAPDRERDERREQITAWLVENGPVGREALRQRFDLPESELALMVSEGLPDRYILMTARRKDQEFSLDDILRAVRRAWDAARETNPDATGLSHVRYDELRGMSDPSGPLIVSRYGWDAICEIAGVPSGQSSRPKRSYRSDWTDDDILRFVARWVETATAEGVRATYNGYDEWQKGVEDAPSGATVRNRLRLIGLGTWASIVAASVEAA